VGKPEGRKPLGRPRRRWVDNIKMDFVEVRRGDVEYYQGQYKPALPHSIQNGLLDPTSLL
jgi:hypothetical protein